MADTAREALAKLLPPQLGLQDLIDRIAHKQGAVTPVSAVTPAFVGEVYFDTVLGHFYRATGTANTDWALQGVAGLSLAELQALDGILATAAELNRAADVSTRIVSVTTSTLAVTEALHDGKTLVCARAAGIAFELPAATGSGARFRIVVGTAFTGDATIKVNAAPGTDTMVGLVLGLDGDGAPANAWTVGGTNDTITMDGSATPNMTQGGFAGDMYEIEDIAAGLWQVNGFVKQTGTEATPMSASVP